MRRPLHHGSGPLALALCALASAPARAAAPATSEGDGLALLARKALLATWDGEQAIDRAVVLVRGGRIEAVGPAESTSIPAGYEVIDLGESWLMPGMIDLHSHVGGSGDINDMVLQCNPELRVRASVEPLNPNLMRAIASGVTTVLFIPGSGTNVGGQGILIKTALPTFEEMRIRDPGSLKIAQGDNPTRWGYSMGRSLMNWHIRDTVQKGMDYAGAWDESAKDGSAEPEVDIGYEIFRDLAAQRTQVSTHTQIYRLVLSTITMLKGEFGLDVFIDHGEFAGYLAAPLAAKMGVGAIVGPREVDTPGSRASDTDGKIVGVAAGYQELGGMQVGFNTDAPVVPQEELFLQAAMGVRYGVKNRSMEAVRGLTIVPARTAKIDDRVGSIEPGKDADLVVITGDPTDPRSHVECVFIEGRRVYDASEGRRF